MKKSRFVILPLIIGAFLLYLFYGDDYQVVEETDAAEHLTVDRYTAELQNSPEIQGYKRFTDEEEKTIVVLSLGSDNQGKGIDVAGVVNDEEGTVITVEFTEEETGKDNPYIIISLDSVTDPLFVQTEGGLFFEEIE